MVVVIISTAMKKILLSLLLIAVVPTCHGQKKIKTAKSPVAWQYTIAPERPLSENLKHYAITIDTDMDPLDDWDEINLRIRFSGKDSEQQRELFAAARNDTTYAWSKKYMELKQYPLARTSFNPDFFIKLTTDHFEMENVQLDVDYSDQESVLGKINVTARLEVRDSEDRILMDDQIVYLLDDRDGPTNLLRLRHLFFNPSFKLKFKMTKKPEKRKKLLEKKVAKFEAGILEFFMEEAGRRLANQFITQQLDAYTAIFSIKDKSFEQHNIHVEEVSKSINSLTAISKKKRKTIDEIKPILKSAIQYWQQELPETTNPTLQDIYNINIAAASLIISDMMAAKLHISNIPELEELGKKTIWEGSFTYYLKGLASAIDIKEKYAERALIYQF